jgi:hypothetical protein
LSWIVDQESLMRINAASVGTWLLFMLVNALGTSKASAISFTTLDDPFGVKGTFAEGVSGNDVVGYYVDSASIAHGFLYNGSTYTTLNDPLGSRGTYAYGISDNNVVGFYYDSLGMPHGFLYDGSSYSTIDDPLGAHGTFPLGISGKNIQGSYADSSGVAHGFVYDGSAFATQLGPLGSAAVDSIVCGLSGSSIVGWYDNSGDSANAHGFVYNGSTYTVVDDPLAANGIILTGISGANLVGSYQDASFSPHGFIYNGSTFTPVDEPLAGGGGTAVIGIDGSKISGYYNDVSGHTHGFVALIPEPSTIVLLGIGAAICLVPACCRRGVRAHLFLQLDSVARLRCLHRRVHCLIPA